MTSSANYAWLACIRFLLISFFVFILGCGKQVSELENFDAQKWKADKAACKNERAESVESLLTQKEKLLGLNEMEIVTVLGKPDQNELYKRNEKFFYYFINPAVKCDAGNAAPKRLVIRFNAVGLAKEMAVE